MKEKIEIQMTKEIMNQRKKKRMRKPEMKKKNLRIVCLVIFMAAKFKKKVKLELNY